ncbi:MAG TPA: hypothetical protein VFK89_12570 [Actinomycetota bacterium]|nr:hypothetical protein [Actinomycetota bacterium]
MKLVVILVTLAMLPLAAATAQEPACDGNFHTVYAIGNGFPLGLEVTGDGDGWVVGHNGVGTAARKVSPWVVHFDSSSASEVTGLPTFRHNAFLRDLAEVTPTDVWAVGGTETRDGGQALALHWDGETWTRAVLPTIGPFAHLTGIKAFASNDIWAVGDEIPADGRYPDTFAMHYDGTSWTQAFTPSPGRYTSLTAIDGSAPNDIWAVGHRGLDQPLALHWDGAAWTRIGLGGDFGDPTILYGVTAPTPAEAWAVGNLAAQPEVLHWVGGQWSTVALPNQRGAEFVLDTAASGTTAWAGGFRSRSDRSRALAYRWDGVAWSIVTVEHNPRFSEVASLETDDSGAAWIIDHVEPYSGEAANYVERACT